MLGNAMPSHAPMVFDKMRTVRLYGALGARFGRSFRLVVDNTAQAVNALCVMLPGFKQYLRDAEGKGMRFAVFHGRENVGEKQLRDPPGGDIRIAPVMTGAKSGWVQIIVGAVLVFVGAVVGMWIPPLGAAIAGLGWGMIVGGVSQLLTPTPKGLGTRESPENAPSYSFAGPVNTQAQGNPVPLCYGEMIVGSAVVSAGIFAEDQL